MLKVWPHLDGCTASYWLSFFLAYTDAVSSMNMVDLSSMPSIESILLQASLPSIESILLQIKPACPA